MARSSTTKLKLAGKSPRKTATKPKVKAKTGTKKSTPAKTAKKPGKVIPLRAKQEAKKPKESVFARLLREKKERQQKQTQGNQQNQFQPTYQSMPSNHAKFSKFAGPRRRAS